MVRGVRFAVVSALAAALAAVGLALPASASVGQPCDVQAPESGAPLYINVTVLGVTTAMVANDSLVGTACATRTPTAPISGNFTVVPILGEYLVGGSTPVTFYELTNMVNIGGVQLNDHYWVASTEVTVAP